MQIDRRARGLLHLFEAADVVNVPVRGDNMLGFKPVAAIGRPESAIWRRHSNYRIEERSRLLDHTGKFFVMSFGEIALKRCWFDGINGKHGNRERRAAQRIPARSDNRSTLLLDPCNNIANGLG